jgi:glycosyltransferase involved in cell wall biosynthesis
MNLCVVSPFPPQISGIGQYGWNVVQGLAHAGRFQSIHVLAGAYPALRLRPPMRSGEVTIEYVWSRDDLGAAARILCGVRRAHPDAVWFNFGFTAFGTSRLANFMGLALPVLVRGLGLPAIVTLHELYDVVAPSVVGAAHGPLTAWGARLATHLLLQADAVCVTLRRYLEELRQRYAAHNLWHIPHGLFAAPELLPPPASAPLEILIFTSFAPHRGLPILLEAFQHIQAAHPDATLAIAGSDHPRYSGYLAAVRATAGERRGVRWLGAQSEAQLRDVFARAKVVVLPYTATAGASSVVHRAIAYGRPVVASDLPDFRLVAEEENLWLDFTPPGDPMALAGALIRVLEDAAHRERMVRHNLAMAQTMTRDHIAARYADLLEQVAQPQTALAGRALAANRWAEWL